MIMMMTGTDYCSTWRHCMARRAKKVDPRRVMVNLTGEEFAYLLVAQARDAVPRSYSAIFRQLLLEAYGDR